jgi:hypothetical protein
MISGFPAAFEKPLYQIVGAIIVRWGLVDTLLTEICSILLVRFGGHPSQKEPPRNFKTRLKFIRKCFGNDPRLGALNSLAISIASDLSEIVKRRDSIIHGAITGYDLDGPVFRFTKLNSDASKYEQTSSDISAQDLSQIANAIEDTISRLVTLGETLNKTI